MGLLDVNVVSFDIDVRLAPVKPVDVISGLFAELVSGTAIENDVLVVAHSVYLGGTEVVGIERDFFGCEYFFIGEKFDSVIVVSVLWILEFAGIDLRT